ncbi:aminotransferase class III-fold pyridoxal phosphate-dependent enzyme [Arthrobacter sp. EpRS71]|uniref:aminotransferase class III-fold pyridoxal phosphate-dependent enzyme n=1 Tax=Arthrobacter sp. EpRS71 TaxID=1743141 RepID=UPI0007463EA8|nr:aminotransferase class III-fold pyridoxal phosphate-dependent enzyme [Arthrobacter sp. EpRS71]KUM36376.1 aminotransferase [Arthrobacter sp. EpRS71]
MSRLLQTGINAGSKPLVKVVGGEGSRFILDDGRRVIDGSNTGGPLGHAHPEMVEAVRKAATAPVINEGWFYAEREQAAQELIDVAFAGEHDWVGAVRFFISGSEANDLALSLSQAFTGRSALATRERAYHGMTGLSRDMTVQPHWHGGLSLQHGGTQPVPRTAPVKILPGPVRAAYGAPQHDENLSERLGGAEEVLSDVAATIIDYTQGGTYYDAAYQDRVAEAARNAGSLWIADEVVTGLGRHGGNWFAFQGGTSRPDIVTLGKPLGGGAAPAGAVVLSKELVENMKDKTWQTYSTFRGHPMLMAAVRAHLRIVQNEGLVERAARMGELTRRRLVEIAEKHPSVARVDGDGQHWTVELRGTDWRNWYGDTLEAPIASKVAARALEAGAMIGTSGERDSLFLSPALNMPEEDLEGLFQALDHGLDVADQALDRGLLQASTTTAS